MLGKEHQRPFAANAAQRHNERNAGARHIDLHFAAQILLDLLPAFCRYHGQQHRLFGLFQPKGGKGLLLITADTYRIAAVEQLKTYANILGIPLEVVYSADEMDKTIDELKEFDLVFVDTAGRSHQNAEQVQDIKKILDKVPEEDKEVYLVLSATTKYKDLKKISEVYRKITEYYLIFTKLDETDTVGNIFNIHMLTGAQLSYATWGQNVPDDIGKMDAQKITKQLLGGNG